MKSRGYVAFLRGINVGGNSVVKTPALKKAFEGLGFVQVTPILASGNVTFHASLRQSSVLQHQIADVLNRSLKLSAIPIVRTDSQIFELLKRNPFEKKKSDPNIKLQVTFLGTEIRPGAKFPLRLPCSEFEVMQVSPGEICSAVDLSTAARTPELMKYLEKEFGKNLTTRTWNTIEKVEKALRDAA